MSFYQVIAYPKPSEHEKQPFINRTLYQNIHEACESKQLLEALFPLHEVKIIVVAEERSQRA